MPDFLPAFPVPLEELLGQFQGRCPICKMPAYVTGYVSGNNMGSNVFCTRCSNYTIQFPTSAHTKWRSLTTSQVANISGYLRENRGMKIESERDVDFLIQLSSPTVAERAHKLLAAIARNHQTPGIALQIDCGYIDNQAGHFLSITTSAFPSDTLADKTALEMFPALSASWCQNQEELKFLLVDYLIKEAGFLESLSSSEGGPKVRFKISAKGWDHLQSSGVANSSTGFVAMWFDSSVNKVWEKAFYPGIKAAGYSPLRIDKKQHNNRIDDEILASIRGSRFIVADFTGDRGGVYFEAGFASGLGKPVIWTVREDWLNKLHFDTRQFNHITWTDGAYDDLRDALRLRIEATIGRGTVL